MDPDDLIEIEPYTKYITKMIKEIYPENDKYMYELFGVKFKPGYIEKNELSDQEIYFDEIQSQIINEIRKAKYTIWVAMAWFTNNKLYNELLKKKQKGVNIQVVIDDNETNRNAPFILENEFETHRVNISTFYKNTMHDKFCIIDLSTVIHGSFNWTNAANWNRETISIDKNTTTASKFADEFMKLKTGIYG